MKRTIKTRRLNPVTKRFKQIYQLNRPGLILSAIQNFPFDQTRMIVPDHDPFELKEKFVNIEYNRGQIGLNEELRNYESNIDIEDDYVEPWESWVSAWATEVNKNLKPLDNAIRKYAYKHGIETDLKFSTLHLVQEYGSTLIWDQLIPPSIQELMSSDDFKKFRIAEELLRIKYWPGWPGEEMNRDALNLLIQSGVKVNEILDLAEYPNINLDEFFKINLFTQRSQDPKDFGNLLYVFADGDYLIQLTKKQECLVEGSRRMLANCLRDSAGAGLKVIVYRDRKDKSRGIMSIMDNDETEDYGREYEGRYIDPKDLVGIANEPLDETSTFTVDGETREPGLITARLVSYAHDYLGAINEEQEEEIRKFYMPEVLDGVAINDFSIAGITDDDD
jgi:hypothetical protein